MGDLVYREEILDKLYRIFDQYNMATDRTSDGGFGETVFKVIKSVPVGYDIYGTIKNLEEIEDDYINVRSNDFQEGAHNGASWMKQQAIDVIRNGGCND